MGWSGGGGWNAKQGWSRPAPSGGGGGAAFTWNPADAGSNAVITNSNRDFGPASAGSWMSCRSNISKSAGKWYCEIAVPTAASASKPNAGIGLAKSDFSTSSYLGSSDTSSGLLFAFPGSFFNSASMVNVTATPSGDTVSPGDIYMMAFDFDSGKAWLGKNGSWFSGMDPVAGTGPWVTWTPGGNWFVAATQNSNSTCTFRLPSTTTYSSPTGYSVLNA